MGASRGAPQRELSAPTLGFAVPEELDAFGSEAGQAYIPLEPLSLPFVIDQIVPALASTRAGGGPATITATPG